VFQFAVIVFVTINGMTFTFVVNSQVTVQKKTFIVSMNSMRLYIEL